jgi:cytochrome P450
LHCRLFFAGFLSTAGRGAWTLQDLLTEDPSYLQRVRTDVDRIVEEARIISDEEPPKVEDHDFLNACITESVRQHPIGTWLRWAEKPFTLPPGPSGESRVIPAGFVAVTTEGIRSDASVYDNADKFDPDRYYRVPFVGKDEYKPSMTDKIRLDSVRAPPLNLHSTVQPSFGVGAHQCAGRLFAYRMIGKPPYFPSVFRYSLDVFFPPPVGTFITTLMESFDLEFYETPENAGGKHKMAITPLFGSRELVSQVMIRLRRREVPF